MMTFAALNGPTADDWEQLKWQSLCNKWAGYVWGRHRPTGARGNGGAEGRPLLSLCPPSMFHFSRITSGGEGDRGRGGGEIGERWRGYPIIWFPRPLSTRNFLLSFFTDIMFIF